MIGIIIYIKLTVLHIRVKTMTTWLATVFLYIMCYTIVLYLDYCFNISVNVDALYFFYNYIMHQTLLKFY